MPEFKYEIAFSFLAGDESLALEIDALVAPSVSTFIYSERQLELVSTDGLTEFPSVFGRDARTVAVLWRPEWGTTHFTGIEERAIKDRVFHDGPDFVTLVALQTPVDPPLWFPRSRIWGDFGSLGRQGVASVLLERVRASGVVVREETAVENAARLARELQAKAARDRIRDSESGVQAANVAYNALEDALRSLAKQTEVTVYERRPGNSVVTFKRGDFAFIPLWQLKYANTVDGARLTLRYFKSSEIGERVFSFHILSETDMAWREESTGRLFSSDRLAEHAIVKLLNYVRKSLLADD